MRLKSAKATRAGYDQSFVSAASKRDTGLQKKLAMKFGEGIRTYKATLGLAQWAGRGAG